MTTCKWCIKAKQLQEDQDKLDEQATTMPSSVYVKKSDIIMGLYKSCNEKCKCESISEEDETEVYEARVCFSNGMLETYYWDDTSNDLYNSDCNLVGKTINEPTEWLGGRDCGGYLIFNYNDVYWLRF